MKHLDMLIPLPQEPTDKFTWATVTSLDPVKVRLDGDDSEAEVFANSLIDTALLTLGARVWTQLSGRQVIVVGQTREASSAVNTTDLEEVEQQVSDAQADLTVIESRMSDAETDIVSVSTRIDGVEGDISTVETTVSSLGSTVSSNSSRIETAEGTITSIDGRVENAELTITSHDTRISDLDDEVADIVEVQLPGKNKVTYSTSAPGSAANTAGDIWFRKNASGEIIGQWEGAGGTSWNQVTLTDSVITNLNAGTITAGTLAAARIGADTIDSTKIVTAGLDAGVIKFGAMHGDRIEAGSLTIGKVSGLTDIANSVRDAQNFSDTFNDISSLAPWAANSGNGAVPGSWSIVTPADAEYGSGVFRVEGAYRAAYHSKQIPLDPTMTYKVTIRARGISGAPRLYAGVRGHNADGTIAGTSNGNWYGAAANITLPIGTEWIEYVGYFRGTGGNGNTRNGNTTVDNPGYLPDGTTYFVPLILAPFQADPSDAVEVSMFKVEAMAANQETRDAAAAVAAADATAKANAAKSEAIAAAAADAQTKADAAKAAAEAAAAVTAQAKADAAEAAAIAAASGAAEDLAEAARLAAIAAAATDAQTKADAAYTAAQADATAKADAARTGAVDDIQDNWGHPSDVTLIDGGNIYTGTVHADLLAADLAEINNLAVGEMSAEYALLGSLSIGPDSDTPVIELGAAAGFTVNHPNGQTSGVSADGSGATWRGDSFVDNLTVSESMSLRGDELYVAGAVTLTQGVSNPTQRPQVTTGYISYPTNGPGFNRRGLSDHHYYADQYVTTDGFGNEWNVQAWVRTASGGSGFWSFPVNSSFNTLGGVTLLGNYYYVLCQQITNPNNWRILVYEVPSTPTGSPTYRGQYQTDPSQSASISPTALPMIGHNGTNVVVVWPEGGALSLRQFLPYNGSGTSLNQTGSTQTSNDSWGANADVRGLAFVGNRYFIAASNSVRAYSTAMNRTPSDQFPPAAGNVMGLSHDGTQFWSFHNNGSRIYRYTNNSGTWKFAFAWRDDDAGGSGTTETRIGPLLTVAPTKYARWRVTLPSSPPDDGTADGANTASLYAAPSGHANVYRQAILPEGTASRWFDSLATTGTVPQSVNGFASRPGSIGEIQSPSGLTTIDGNDAVRMSKFLQSGVASVNISASDTGSVNVSFPTPFDAVPQVAASPRNSSVYFATVSSVTESGFTVTLRHFNGTNLTATIPVNWLATTAS